MAPIYKFYIVYTVRDIFQLGGEVEERKYPYIRKWVPDNRYIAKIQEP